MAGRESRLLSRGKLVDSSIKMRVNPLFKHVNSDRIGSQFYPFSAENSPPKEDDKPWTAAFGLDPRQVAPSGNSQNYGRHFYDD